MPKPSRGMPSLPSYRPSMAASFMGCTFVTSTALPSPENIHNRIPTRPTAPPTLIDLTAKSTLRFFIRNHPLTHTTKAPARHHPLVTAWMNLFTATGDRATSRKLTITLRIWSAENSMPTGYCIHELATRIHHALRLAPKAVSHVAARCWPAENFFHPKNITAKKVLSQKKAKMPSMASGAPKMSPTNHE